MPLDPNIILQAGRGVEPVQPPDLLGQYGKLLALKNMVAQQPLIQAQIQRAGLENQQLTQQIGGTQALNDAYKTAVSVGADGTPSIDKTAITNSLATKGFGSQIPVVMEHLTKYETDLADLQKKKNDLDLGERNALGSAGLAAKAADYDPTVAMNSLDLAAAHGYKGAAQIKQAIAADPTKVKAIVDQAIANSPEASKYLNEKATADARQQAAGTAATKEAREAAVQQRAQALQQAAGVTDQASYNNWVGRNPILKSEAPGAYDPAFVSRLMREAVPVKDQPEFDIKQQEAATMSKMTPKDWENEVNQAVRDPKLNASTKALLMNAPTWQAKQQAIRSAVEQQSILDRETNPSVINAQINKAVAIQNAETKAGSPALAGVAPRAVAAASSDYQKSGKDYANAVAAQQEMQDMVNLMRSGNKVAYAYSPVTGVLTINSANGTKRVNMSEIEQYGGAGSAWDRIKGFVGKQATGESVPANIVDAMEEVHKTLGGVAQQKHANEVKVINQTYGSTFKPIELAAGASPSGAGAAASLPAAARAQLKEGVITHFGNGQSWTLKNGQPVQQ